MPDFDVPFGEDFWLTPAGDLATVDGLSLNNQLLERRLFTAVLGYYWHLEYAAGLPERIGKVARRRDIAAIVRSQCSLEASISHLPPPIITVTFDAVTAGLCVIEIEYLNAITNTMENIKLEVPGTL